VVGPNVDGTRVVGVGIAGAEVGGFGVTGVIITRAEDDGEKKCKSRIWRWGVN
jgi:hypothetical protein